MGVVLVLATPAPAATTPDPASLLLQQATYWRAQNAPDKAEFALRRLLDLQPNSVDALVLLAQLDIEGGNLTEGQEYYDRLRRLDPTNRRIAAIEQSLRIGPVDQTRLADARRLSGLGRSADAVRAYQSAFHGTTPPPGLAVEYYFVLGITGIEGFETARKALGAAVTADPADAALQIAYARLLCDREFTRADGIARLQLLAKIPAVATSARAVWRQVILWQGASIDAMRQLRAYMAANPPDPQILAEYQDYQQTVPSEQVQARDRGYSEIDDNQWDAAERDFSLALQLNPNDWRAVVMLAAIRNHQNRTQDAHDLILRAIAIKPDQKDAILKSSGGDWSREALAARGLIGKSNWTAADARRAVQRGAAAFRNRTAEITRLIQAGQYDRAEALLHRQFRGPAEAAGLVQLADIELAAGQTDRAEASYRAALARQPGSGDAAAGLARLLTQVGRPDEAAGYYAEAEELYRRAHNRRGPLAMISLRAQQVRATADAQSDPAHAVPLLLQAVAIDADDAWIRLDLAQALRRAGRVADARRVMAEIAGRNDAAAIEAGIYWAQSDNDLAGASALIARLPARSRTEQMRSLQQQVALQQDIARIEAEPAGEDRGGALVALAAGADPTGERVAAIADALVRIGTADDVPAAVRGGLSATAAPTDAQRLAYSAALVAADSTEQAASLADSVDDGALAPPQAARLDDVKDSIAVARADRLNAESRPADAYDTLAPRLAADPQDPSLRLALSRLYASNGRPRDAVAITRAVLNDDTADMNVRRQAIGSAMAAKDYDEADRLVQGGIRLQPADPTLYVLAASIAQAQGARLRAVHELQTARTLRQRQLATIQETAP